MDSGKLRKNLLCETKKLMEP